MIKLDQKQIGIMAIIIVIMIGTIGYYIYSNLQKADEDIIQITESENIVEETNQYEEEQIIVHIAGEVQNPGIIKTKEGARIADIIRRSRRID